MALTLFVVNDKGVIVLGKEAIKLCPGLKLLTPQQLKYIILVYDYQSKYRLSPLDQRKNKASMDAYGSNFNPEIDPLVQKGIEEYSSLQYDDKRETRDAYQTKIFRIRDRLIYEEDTAKLKRDLETIKLLQIQIKELDDEIETDFRQREIKGGGKLSLIEMLQENKEKFKKQVRKIEDIQIQE